jgi:hypothetical protein
VARAVDRGGWDGFFLWDHILVDRGAPMPVSEPWTTLAAVATATRHVRLGTLVVWAIAADAAACRAYAEAGTTWIIDGPAPGPDWLGDAMAIATGGPPSGRG